MSLGNLYGSTTIIIHTKIRNVLDKFLFIHPYHERNQHIEIDILIEEFTSLCPITGQPDFGRIDITYKPGKYCIESKSLKLYLGGFRQSGLFHEECVSRICYDLDQFLYPVRILVRGSFNTRGGISINPTAFREKE